MRLSRGWRGCRKVSILVCGERMVAGSGLAKVNGEKKLVWRIGDDSVCQSQRRVRCDVYLGRYVPVTQFAQQPRRLGSGGVSLE